MLNVQLQDAPKVTMEKAGNSHESFDSLNVERGNRSNISNVGNGQDQALALDISYPRMATFDEAFRIQIEAALQKALDSADKRLLQSELDHEQKPLYDPFNIEIQDLNKPGTRSWVMQTVQIAKPDFCTLMNQ